MLSGAAPEYLCTWYALRAFIEYDPSATGSIKSIGVCTCPVDQCQTSITLVVCFVHGSYADIDLSAP